MIPRHGRIEDTHVSTARVPSQSLKILRLFHGCLGFTTFHSTDIGGDGLKLFIDGSGGGRRAGPRRLDQPRTKRGQPPFHPRNESK
jgi:hypothetical protein